MSVLVALFVALSTPAYAYLDASTGSIIVQAVIGVVASSLVFARLYLGKIKAFFTRSRPAETGHASDADG